MSSAISIRFIPLSPFATFASVKLVKPIPIPFEPPHSKSETAIIGAGPSGLCAAKYLKSHADFQSITIFEQRGEVGGVWNYSDLARGRCSVPQTDPFYPSDGPYHAPQIKAPIFPTALYDNLHANIPGFMMSYSNQAFPKQCKLFPQCEEILDYLEGYGEEIRNLIKFCYKVNKVSLALEDGRDRWHLEAQSTVNPDTFSDTFDAVVVASGHFSVPYLPNIRNIASFDQSHPSVISHSMQYRRASEFNDKKVIVVGNGSSGLDIAMQINKVSRGKVILSVRSATPPEKLAHVGCEEAPEIAEFLAEERSVRFINGRVESHVDAIIFCTGFLYSFPFLSGVEKRMITTGRGVHGLYQHIFYIRHPTLAFPALTVKSIPWPLSEVQAAVISAVWSNRIKLPSTEKMEGWSRELYERHGEALHVFEKFGDGAYINELCDWLLDAELDEAKVFRWSDENFWQQSVIGKAKLRFEREGCKAFTLDELGLHYDPEWRKQAQKVDMTEELTGG